MQNERSTDSGCASPLTDTSAAQPGAAATEGQEDVEGFFDIRRLDPPVCLPVLPKYPTPQPVIEPLGDPRGRELLP